MDRHPEDYAGRERMWMAREDARAELHRIEEKRVRNITFHGPVLVGAGFCMVHFDLLASLIP